MYKKIFASTIARLLLVLLAVSLAVFILHHKHEKTVDNQKVANVAMPMEGVDTSLVKDGPYTGWTHYHNNNLGFSINASPVVTVDDYATASPSDPSYATFLMDLSSDSSGRTIEFLHLAIYEADLMTSAQYQDNARSDIYQVAPTKEDVTIAGHKAKLYYYDSDIRAALYLIDDGPRTFAINGFIHTKDPQSVANYWQGFENTINTFAIDEPTAE